MDFHIHHCVTVSVDECLLGILGRAVNSLESLAADVKISRVKYVPLPSDTTGGAVVAGQTIERKTEMAKKYQCECVKKTPIMKAAVPHVKSALSTQSFKLLDDGTGTFTFFGTNAVPGELVDVSAVATLTATPQTPVPTPGLTITGPTGMAITCKAPPSGSGHELIDFVATWNDGSIGPIPVTADISWDGGKVTGGVIVQS